VLLKGLPLRCSAGVFLAVLPNSDDLSYLVLLEAVLLLLVCTSTQLYTQQTSAPAGSQPLLEALMEQQQSAAALVSALLRLAVQRPPLPAKLVLYTPPPDGSTSMMRLVRTAAGRTTVGRRGGQWDLGGGERRKGQGVLCNCQQELFSVNN